MPVPVDKRPTVLVTGASSGIGAACVDQLHKNGWRVFAGVREISALTHVHQLGEHVTPITLDVTDAGSIANARERLSSEFGLNSLDALVNNAGIAIVAPFLLTDPTTWRKIYDVNVFGVVAVTQAFIPMLLNGHARIANIASSSATETPAMAAAYASSKRALVALSDSLREEYCATNLVVSVISPDVIATSIWDKAIDYIDTLSPSTDVKSRDSNRAILASISARLAYNRDRGTSPTRVAEIVLKALTESQPAKRYTVE